MKKAPFLVFLFILLLAASCAVNPVTGRRELNLISENQEIALGKETDKEIRIQYGIYDDSSLNQYVERIGKMLTPHTHRSHLNYYFSVLDTPVINAFAVPGGYIYLTRGILAMMNSEAALAAVLSHELGHVNARHSVRRMSKLLLVKLGLGVGGALSETFAKISGVASVGIQLLFLKYSRDDEREADALGVKYSRKGGFNPGEMVGFFDSLQRLGDLSEDASLPGFLSTHPLTSERIRNVKGMLEEADRRGLVHQQPYLNQIDNIVFGEDPRQGYAEKNTFYHPQLRFFFSFPEDWTLKNTPTQVVLASKDGNGALILQAEKSSEELSVYIQKKTSNIEGKELIREQSLNINSLSAYQQHFDVVRQDKEDLRLQLTCIRKGSYIFSFTALSTIFDFKKYETPFQSIVGSFNELRDKTHLDRKPKRLKAIQANGRKTLQQIFLEAGMDKDIWPKMAIMNGIALDQTPERNQLVKTIK